MEQAATRASMEQPPALNRAQRSSTSSGRFVGCCWSLSVIEPTTECPAAESSDIRPLTYYHELDSVLRQLEGPAPPVRLLDSAWLLQRADAFESATSDEERAALALPHRQELEKTHPDAFMSVQDVRTLEHAYRPDGCAIGYAIGAVSHAWARADHPDRAGSSLLHIARQIRAAQRGELAVQQPGAVATPFGQTEHRKLPSRVALFYDWCSLHQAVKAADGTVIVPRSPSEQAAFTAALRSMEVPS
jgi:hypothetical protein